MKAVLAALLLAAAPAAAQEVIAQPVRTAPAQAPQIPSELLAAYDFSLADTANKRTALAYLYTAWNEGRLREARLTYWRRGSFPELEAGGAANGPPGPSPQYTIHRVVEEGHQVVVLALVRGIGMGEPFTNIFGQRATKIGDAVVEVFRFDESGLIAAKVDIIEPMSEASYDFRD